MANEKRLIDANALMERLKFKRRNSEVGLHRGLQSAMTQCEKAPTVDAVEVVHGRWIETKNGFHCSNCKRKPGRHQTKQGAYLSNYCPNCGAKMDGDGNE
jgi:hypothetical protein